MAQNPSFIKRQKELARLEWQQEKAAKRKQRKLEKEKELTDGDKPADAPVAPVAPDAPKG